MDAHSSAQFFLDGVFDRAVDIAERKPELRRNENMVRLTLDKAYAVDKVCRFFLDEVSVAAVDTIIQRLAAIGSFDHSLKSQQENSPDDDQSTSSPKSTTRPDVVAVTSGWPQTESNVNADVLNSRNQASQPDKISKSWCASSPDTSEEAEPNTSSIQSRWLQAGGGHVNTDELSSDSSPSDGTSKVCVSGSSPCAPEMESASDVQFEWPHTLSRGDETGEQSQKGYSNCDSSVTVSGQIGTTNEGMDMCISQVRVNGRSIREQSTNSVSKPTQQEAPLQPREDEVQLQEGTDKASQQSKESPTSANIFFKLARELLESERENIAVAQSQQTFASRNQSFWVDEEASSCPCRFDWGIGQPEHGSSGGCGLLDVDILEMNDVDEFMADDQEVPSELGLDTFLGTEAEISLYNESDTKAQSPPLELEDSICIEKPPRQEIHEISALDVTPTPVLGPATNDAQAEGPSEHQSCEDSSSAELISMPTSQSDDVDDVAASEDVTPGHQWFQTMPDERPVETVKRVTPIPSCNRRRRVGLSRTQRVPSLHSKRLRLAEE